MIVVAAALLAAFVALGVWLGTGGAVVALDAWVQAGMRPLRVRPVVLAFDWLTQMGTGGTGAAVALAASALLWAGGRGVLVVPLWACFVGAEATSWGAKFVFGRARPEFLAGVSVGSPSYPSAHATVSVAVYGFLALVVAAAVPGRATVLVVAGLWIGLIMFSRVLLSVHFLSDVVGGALVGTAWVLLCWRWAQSL